MIAVTGTRVTAAAEADGRLATAVRDLPPAAFGFVMATGIISAGADVLGPTWLSTAFLVVAAAGLIALVGLLLTRLAKYPHAVAADARSPERAFGFFTIVAGLNVLGLRLDGAGHPAITAVLAALAAVLWLGLTYAMPIGLLVASNREPVLSGVNGTWLLWAVGTQSLAISASLLVPAWPAQANLLAPVATTLWSVGVVLYLVLVTLIVVRWLTVPLTPATLGPPYWLLMGATAITVRAGAQLLALPSSLPVREAVAGLVTGFTYLFWSFGTWWIPLLLVLGCWRHLVRRWPLRYQTDLWSVVFPLGMYSAATDAFGHVANLGFMTPIARVVLWVAITAWLAVAAAAVASLIRRPPARSPRGSARPSRDQPR